MSKPSLTNCPSALQHEARTSGFALDRVFFSFQVCQSHNGRESGRHNWVAIASVFHLFPSRTEKLSPGAPMVLHRNVGE